VCEYKPQNPKQIRISNFDIRIYKVPESISGAFLMPPVWLMVVDYGSLAEN